MSRALLVAGGLFAALPARAADVCETAKLTLDPFKGDAYANIQGRGYTIFLEPDRQSVQITITENGVVAKPLPPRFEVQFVLLDGSRITLVSAMQSDPVGGIVATAYTALASTSWVLAFQLTPEAIHTFAQSAPVALRYTIDGESTLTYSTVGQTLFRRDFACASNRVPLVVAADTLVAASGDASPGSPAADTLVGTTGDAPPGSTDIGPPTGEFDAPPSSSGGASLVGPIVVAGAGAAMAGGSYAAYAAGADPGAGAWRMLQGVNALGWAAVAGGAAWGVVSLTAGGGSDVMVVLTPGGPVVAGRF